MNDEDSIVKRVVEDGRRAAIADGDTDERGVPTELGRKRRGIDDLRPMTAADLEIVRRRIAVDQLEEARIAWRTANRSPTEPNLRAAMTACMRAAVAARRASMAEESLRLEESYGRLREELDKIATGGQR